MKKVKEKNPTQEVDIHASFRASGVRVTEEAIKVWEKLQLDLKYWQRELRLDDMDIELRWLAWDEHPNDAGRFDDFYNVHAFSIGVRPPHQLLSIPNYREFNCDYEVILVHELLHARNSRWYCNDEILEILEEEPLHRFFEESIDVIAEALVRARRGITR